MNILQITIISQTNEHVLKLVTIREDFECLQLAFLIEWCTIIKKHEKQPMPCKISSLILNEVCWDQCIEGCLILPPLTPTIFLGMDLIRTFVSIFHNYFSVINTLGVEYHTCVCLLVWAKHVILLRLYQFTIYASNLMALHVVCDIYHLAFHYILFVDYLN